MWKLKHNYQHSSSVIITFFIQEDLNDLVATLNDKVRKLEEELQIPCQTRLAEVFGDNKHICKLRKKNNPAWDAKSKEEL